MPALWRPLPVAPLDRAELDVTRDRQMPPADLPPFAEETAAGRTVAAFAWDAPLPAGMRGAEFPWRWAVLVDGDLWHKGRAEDGRRAKLRARDGMRAAREALSRHVALGAEAVSAPPTSPPRASETWTVTLSGELLDVLDALAEARNRASPDAFGALGHRANVVRDALLVGLRAMAGENEDPPASRRIRRKG